MVGFGVDTSQKEDDIIHAVVMFINNNIIPNGEKSPIEMWRGATQLEGKLEAVNHKLL